jgi:hypothetical protein
MSAISQLFPGGFDANAVEPDAGRDFAPLPAGPYEAEITSAEVKDASTGSGSYLKLELTVIGPTHTGRKVWANITLRNASAQAESIGQAQLSSLCRAVGVAKLTDTDQLFQKLVRIRLKIKPAQGSYQAGNEVTAYEALGPGAQAPAASRPAANTPAATPAAAPKAAPWAKK